MKVISESNEPLNSSVAIDTIDGSFGLIMESRGGAKGKSNERNTDYFGALDIILKRLQNNDVESIRIHIVSSHALRAWSTENRIIEVDGSKILRLKGVDLKQLRGKISKSQQDKKDNPSSKGGNPTKRILIEADISKDTWKDIVLGCGFKYIPLTESDVEKESEGFSPEDADKAKEKISRDVALRRGQSKFRQNLLRAYENSCAVTGTVFPPILEAAHIVPYMGKNTNHLTNGILLRADIHTLFDLGLLGINQHYEIVVAASMSGTEYETYNGKKIKLPTKKADFPSLDALKTRPLPSRH
ncbi:HNH endonuclease [Aeromonas veronii]|uniref:HNH endonuclease n=1 Tax=Aeromonas veronii TaxID=654 RepID=UPI001F387617|nr:HNH endonuclease [Aeromonas veronii]MCF5857684.1 HNH endonuclease [Aeromonas veronii]